VGYILILALLVLPDEHPCTHVLKETVSSLWDTSPQRSLAIARLACLLV